MLSFVPMSHPVVTADSLLAPLNPPQRDAVTTTKGPVLVLAGAGSGKTRVIAHRIAYLLAVEGIDPRHVLAVTFTNKAAAEMRHRVEALLLPAGIRPPLIATFHSACVRILRQRAAQAGLPPSFVIYDEDDRQSLVKEALRELDFDERTLTPSTVVHRISHCKNQMLSPADVEQAARTPREERLASLYRLYEEKLQAAGALDFDDLLLRVVRLLETQPEALRWYRTVWSHVLVDEYQDTNRAQYRIVQLLTEEHRNLCVVGDPDQSVYRWRGADLRNILDFEKDYPDCRVVALEQNYRSTKRILDIASAVIVNNTARKDKRLWTENGEGERAEVYRAWDENEESAFVAQKIRGLRGEGRRVPGRRGVLPHQRAVPRPGRRAAPRGHPVPDRGRRALLRATRDPGHGGLPPPDLEPARRRGLPPRGGRARARDRQGHARSPGRRGPRGGRPAPDGLRDPARRHHRQAAPRARGVRPPHRAPRGAARRASRCPR